MNRLLVELEDDEVVLVADWKMKFLMSALPRGYVRLLRQARMPWHGCMLVRKPLRREADQYGEGEFVCEYKDAMMLGSKEDGYRDRRAVHVALEYHSQYPHIARCVVKTDGAAAYALARPSPSASPSSACSPASV